MEFLISWLCVQLILFYLFEYEEYIFKLSDIRHSENLYSLNILNELNQQKLPLWNNLTDLFIFYLTVYEEDNIQIIHEI
ncbi:conserved hypothetical protein [Histoplasma capsulatum H143]|uniref:Uncharacterized protein n=1 Tax=Ajellomyces capsulatus (strain H143) TaxID=544712 RepID=C6HBD1_AJECH|nr:conserved hypothetical protein [Histoplasma capsulatum H143]